MNFLGLNPLKVFQKKEKGLTIFVKRQKVQEAD